MVKYYTKQYTTNFLKCQYFTNLILTPNYYKTKNGLFTRVKDKKSYNKNEKLIKNQIKISEILI